MGLSAAGVWGIKLGRHDVVVGATLVNPDGDLLVVTRQGMGKCTPMSEYPKQGRYGQGNPTIALTGDKDTVASVAVVEKKDRVALISKNRYRKISYARNLLQVGRFDAGQQLIALRGRDEIVALVRLGIT
jgi:DNA gyrase subunit A